MKVFVYVEGESDKLALMALWERWLSSLHAQGMGISVIPLDDKAKYLRKIGVRAAEKLVARTDDLVIGLPDRSSPNVPVKSRT